MAAYGNAAVKAVTLYATGKASSIVDGWENRNARIFQYRIRPYKGVSEDDFSWHLRRR